MTGSTMTFRTVVVAASLIVPSLAACNGSAQAGAERVSHCGPGYTLIAEDHPDQPLGGCSGGFQTTYAPPETRVHVGDELHVDFAGKVFTDGYPRPLSDQPTVVYPRGGDANTAYFVARHAGKAVLAVRTIYCGSFKGSIPPGPADWQTCPSPTVRPGFPKARQCSAPWPPISPPSPAARFGSWPTRD